MWRENCNYYISISFFILLNREEKEEGKRSWQILFFLAKNTEIRQISKLDFRINTYNKEEEGKKD